ncbi:MAG: hypothetical protein DHS80DRAFT_25836 [Piptocephalis tieghemiana]|nr:MAG: hypothetical protein DHS80DRAFT_25836 [Piptocephalis tieghemiana]
MSKSAEPDQLEQARRAFQAGDFDLAHDLLTDLCRLWPHDQALARNLRLTTQLRHNSPKTPHSQELRTARSGEPSDPHPPGSSSKSPSSNPGQSTTPPLDTVNPPRKPSDDPQAPSLRGDHDDCSLDPVERYNEALVARCVGRLTDALGLLKPLVDRGKAEGSREGAKTKGDVEKAVDRGCHLLWLDLHLLFGDRQGAFRFIQGHRHLHQGDPIWQDLERRAYLDLEDFGDVEDSAHATSCFSRARLLLENGNPRGAMDLMSLSKHPGTGWVVHANIACVNVSLAKYALAEVALNHADTKLTEEVGEGSSLFGPSSSSLTSIPSSADRALLEVSFTLIYHQGLLAHRKGHWISAWRRLAVCVLHERFLHSPTYWTRLGESLLKRREALGPWSTHLSIPLAEPLDPSGTYSEIEEQLAVQRLLPHLQEAPRGNEYLVRLSTQIIHPTPEAPFLSARSLLILAILSFRKAEITHQESPVPSPFFSEHLASCMSRSLHHLSFSPYQGPDLVSNPIAETLTESAKLSHLTYSELSSRIAKDYSDLPFPPPQGSPRSVAETLRNALAFTFTASASFMCQKDEVFHFLRVLTPHLSSSSQAHSSQDLIVCPELLERMSEAQVADYLWWLFSLHHLSGFLNGPQAYLHLIQVIELCMYRVSREQRSLLSPWHALFLGRHLI